MLCHLRYRGVAAWDLTPSAEQDLRSPWGGGPIPCSSARRARGSGATPSQSNVAVRSKLPRVFSDSRGREQGAGLRGMITVLRTDLLSGHQPDCFSNRTTDAFYLERLAAFSQVLAPQPMEAAGDAFAGNSRLPPLACRQGSFPRPVGIERFERPTSKSQTSPHTACVYPGVLLVAVKPRS